MASTGAQGQKTGGGGGAGGLASLALQDSAPACGEESRLGRAAATARLVLWLATGFRRGAAESGLAPHGERQTDFPPPLFVGAPASGPAGEGSFPGDTAHAGHARIPARSLRLPEDAHGNGALGKTGAGNAPLPMKGELSCVTVSTAPASTSVWDLSFAAMPPMWKPAMAC